jgi:hypothetical protein
MGGIMHAEDIISHVAHQCGEQVMTYVRTCGFKEHVAFASIVRKIMCTVHTNRAINEMAYANEIT